MSDVTKSATPSMDISQANQVAAGNLYAGEDLAAVAPCYIKASDGLVYMSDGSASDEVAKFVGFTARATKSGQPVTLFGFPTRFKYSSGLTPGAIFYISTTTGALGTTASTGDSKGTAMAVSATDIVVCRVDPKNG